MDYGEIQQQQDRLGIYRSRLSVLLKQQAVFGAHVPPHIVTEIADIRLNIAQIKNTLHTARVAVDDLPDDLPPQEQPSRRIGRKLGVSTNNTTYYGLCTAEGGGQTSIQFTVDGIHFFVTAESHRFWEARHGL